MVLTWFLACRVYFPVNGLREGMNINLATFGLCTTLIPPPVDNSEPFLDHVVVGDGTPSTGTSNTNC